MKPKLSANRLIDDDLVLFFNTHNIEFKITMGVNQFSSQVVKKKDDFLKIRFPSKSDFPQRNRNLRCK